MWWGCKREVDRKEEDKPKWWTEWLEIQGLYPIGSRFQFLGREMIVRCYGSYIPPNRYIPCHIPDVQCSYSDNNGVIHDYRFTRDEWKFLFKLKY